MNRSLHFRLIPEWLRRALTDPVSELSRWQRTARYAVDLARHCAGELSHDKAGQMAAALTYHTLFSMLPTLVLVLVALNAFVGDERRAEFKETAVNAAVNILEGRPLAGGNGNADRRQEFDAVRLRLDEELQGILDSLERVNFGSIGLVGILVFIYAATGLLATVERSFNSVFGVPSGRPWYLRLPLYYTVITLAPIVILLGQWLEGQLLGAIQAGRWTNWLAGPAAVASPVFATGVVIYLMYVLLPTATVGKRAALAGSIVAAALLVATRELFGIYVSRAVVTTLYGALALLPLFLLLLFITWLIVLFGLELTYTLDAMQDGEFKRERYKPREEQLVDPAWMIPLGVHLAEGFRGGKACSAEDLGKAMRLPGSVIDKMLGALTTAGIVHRVVEKDRHRFSLARPAASIRVAEILDVARDVVRSAGDRTEHHPAWKLVEDLRDCDRTRVEDRTLEDLAREGDQSRDAR